MVGLNISTIEGNRQKLVNLINVAVKNWDINTPLPDVLLMTEDQYSKLKVSKQFGDRNQIYWKAEDRIFHTESCVMEVKIVSPSENTIA